MNYLYYIVIIVISIPFVYRNIQKIKYLSLNRNFLKNRNIQDKVNPLVMKALTKYNFKGYFPSEYTKINVMQLDEKTHLLDLVLFILSKKELYFWNPVERLVRIKGYKVNDTFLVKSLEDSNSMDLGQMIPNVSNIPLNRLFRNRRWENQKAYWNLYKKDWEVNET